MALAKQALGVGTLGSALLLGLGLSATASQTDAGDLDTAVSRAAWESIAAGESSGFSVAVDLGGDELYSAAFGARAVAPHDDLDVGSPYSIEPLLDAFVCVRVMQLAEQGRVELDAPLGTYLPSFETSEHGLSLHHLLAHTSGLLLFDELVAGEELDPAEAVAFERRLAEGALDNAPGTCYRYSAADTWLAARVVEAVSEQDLADSLREHLFTPAGMESTGFRERNGEAGDAFALAGGVDASPAPWLVDGVLFGTVRDLVAFQRGLVDETLLSEDSFATMTRTKRLRDGSALPVGYAVRRGKLGEQLVLSVDGAANGTRLHLAFYPETRMTVALLGHDEDAPLDRFGRTIARLVFEVPPDGGPTLQLNEGQLAEYAGLYQVGCTHVEVRIEDGGLVFDSMQRTNIRLAYLGGDTFASKTDPEIRLIFERQGDEVGAVIVDDHGIVFRAGKIS